MSVKVKCENSGNEIDISEGFLTANQYTGQWKFTYDQNPEEQNNYYIYIGEIIESPEAFVDFLAHLRQKPWFNPDDFFDFILRFKQQNHIRGG